MRKGGASVEQRDECAFRCGECGHSYKAAPTLIKDASDEVYHPWRYYADCPVCDAEAQPQAHWERNLLKAWANSTGPKTAAGIAAVTKNIEGHPTPDETLRTRFNAMKHGLYARTARFFPARPGSYPECEHCPHFETRECVEVDACLAKAEIFIRFQAAAAAGDPSTLMEIWADNQASLQALINQIILQIAMDGGPRLKSPQWYYDKEGDFHIAAYVDDHGQKQTIYELNAHPLLKPLIDLISKNHMTLADMELTPRAQDEAEALVGHLDPKSSDLESVTAYQKHQDEQIAELREMIKRSQDATLADPIALEYHGQPDA